MRKNAMKCNETLSKWCKNKHGASKIIDTFEMYQKATPKKGEGSRGPKWRSLKDECIAEAWKMMSIDPISGANQNSDTYWERVKVSFDERKLMDPTFNKMHMDRNPSGMSHHWGIIQKACNKWHGIQQEVMDRQESGTNIEDLVSHAPLLTGWHLHLFS
jgi:hypothetical protein